MTCVCLGECEEVAMNNTVSIHLSGIYRSGLRVFHVTKASDITGIYVYSNRAWINACAFFIPSKQSSYTSQSIWRNWCVFKSTACIWFLLLCRCRTNENFHVTHSFWCVINSRACLSARVCESQSSWCNRRVEPITQAYVWIQIGRSEQKDTKVSRTKSVWVSVMYTTISITLFCTQYVLYN